MELQWPLIIFTTLVAWSAGLFATQCLLALKGEGKKAQMTAWIVAAALLVVGGIAVFFHLEHWDRIFNGFGHLSSGITQELIAIVVLAVVAVVYLAFMRKSDDGASVPAWLAVVGVAASIILVGVMGHSYMMASLPAWNSFLQLLSLIGGAAVMGPATMVLLMTVRGDEVGGVAANTLLIGSAVNVVTAIAYIGVMATTSSSLTSVGYYFDPTTPNAGMVDASAVTPFAGDAMMFTVLAIVCSVVALACAFVGKKQGKWAAWAGIAVACAVVCAFALRIVFYHMGVSAFPFF